MAERPQRPKCQGHTEVTCGLAYVQPRGATLTPSLGTVANSLYGHRPLRLHRQSP